MVLVDIEDGDEPLIINQSDEWVSVPDIKVSNEDKITMIETFVGYYLDESGIEGYRFSLEQSGAKTIRNVKQALVDGICNQFINVAIREYRENTLDKRLKRVIDEAEARLARKLHDIAKTQVNAFYGDMQIYKRYGTFTITC